MQAQTTIRIGDFIRVTAISARRYYGKIGMVFEAPNNDNPKALIGAHFSEDDSSISTVYHFRRDVEKVIL